MQIVFVELKYSGQWSS